MRFKTAAHPTGPDMPQRPAAQAPANAAFFYHPDSVDVSKPKLMGRHAAGEGFLAGFVRASGVERFYCYAESEAHAQDFARRVSALGGGDRPVVWLRRGDLPGLAQAGCLSLPHPSMAQSAWLRRHGDARAFSLSGVFHTTASASIMEAIADYAVAPLQPWDAAICPSLAVKGTVERILATWADYLERRTGGRAQAPLMLPVIPLGVDAAGLAVQAASAADRARLRAELKIADGAVAVLFVGRLSYHAKANPYPLYVGMAEAHRRTGRPLHLVMAGWFANDSIEQTFRTAARALCPDVPVSFVDGRRPEVRHAIWSAADVFASLSDNVQETFGLTPIEAMAAGLPVVVSDWDGYRETVRHGVDGFAVPTLMPPPGDGLDLAMRHAAEADTYDRYIGGASQSVAVDVPATAEALAALAADEGLRRRMGEAGRARAMAEYDWPVIVRRYQELWRELAARRAKVAEIAPRGPADPPNPRADDPYALFAHYATATLGPKSVVALVPGADIAALGEGAGIVAYIPHLLASGEPLARLLAALKSRPATVSALLASHPKPDHARLRRTIAWLYKAGLVRIAPS